MIAAPPCLLPCLLPKLGSGGSCRAPMFGGPPCLPMPPPIPPIPPTPGQQRGRCAVARIRQVRINMQFNGADQGMCYVTYQKPQRKCRTLRCSGPRLRTLRRGRRSERLGNRQCRRSHRRRSHHRSRRWHSHHRNHRRSHPTRSRRHRYHLRMAAVSVGREPQGN